MLVLVLVRVRVRVLVLDKRCMLLYADWSTGKKGVDAESM